MTYSPFTWRRGARLPVLPTLSTAPTPKNHNVECATEELKNKTSQAQLFSEKSFKKENLYF
jgi:hypothetical protein